MSTPAITPYGAKLYAAKGGYYFMMAHCPACKLEFRLLWPVRILKYPEKAVLHLKYPSCQHLFSSDQLEAGKICHIACDCEHFPAAPLNPFLRKIQGFE
jgi:hypothetical protein